MKGKAFPCCPTRFAVLPDPFCGRPCNARDIERGYCRTLTEWDLAQGADFCFGIHRLGTDATIALLSSDVDSAFALALFVWPRLRRHWLRAKFGGGRFRLFFGYSSSAKIIIYAWVNTAIACVPTDQRATLMRCSKRCLTPSIVP